MYIKRLVLENIRTFVSSDIDFVHPDGEFRSSDEANSRQSKLMPRPRLSNVNLLLGENASGKTTILQAIALAALGPTVREAELPLRKLVRLDRNVESRSNGGASESGDIIATFTMHPHDRASEEELGVMQNVERRGELETIECSSVPIHDWSRVYESRNDSFFCVGYGAYRRVASPEGRDLLQPGRTSFLRSRRVGSLFEDDFPLNRLSNWLPKLRSSNPSRHEEAIKLLNKLMATGHVGFSDKLDGREYLFDRGGTLLPFNSLSDGYRGFVGWVADLLWHLCVACPRGVALVDIAGIVMVDEIDLLLHPRWQMKVVDAVARTFPRIQFIFTSHSPLVAGSLEWMNIITLSLAGRSNRTVVKRLKQSIHGLDADQILLSDFFGLPSTIAPAMRKRLKKLTDRIRAGDSDAPLQLIREMAAGMEEDE